ncbi:hypothetical protein CcI49_05055 [Frankia sp. CcI49]|uniref:hypothetical protein n=1 Tax=Frankia sp. CcI49 TaxID=1745382 RepID=UPI0009767CD1|nr:hypothetical protein [Frankia sp. CcI49]ONH61593.1 hypothetical protein CcI49_05055 [Frankia sp. CcI49]
MIYPLCNGDRIVPAVDPAEYTGIVAFTLVPVLGATALPARTIARASWSAQRTDDVAASGALVCGGARRAEGR